MSSDDKTFGERLHTLRRRRDWSMDDLSDRSGVSKSTIHRIERERTQPTLDTLKGLADALDIPLGELAEWSHNPT